jgi:hypothetical protein
VIAHGRERFENGDIIAKRDLLLALGSSPTLYDGKIELKAYDWLIPIKDGLPELKTEYEKVRTSHYASIKAETDALASVRSTWLPLVDVLRTYRSMAI